MFENAHNLFKKLNIVKKTNKKTQIMLLSICSKIGHIITLITKLTAHH